MERVLSGVVVEGIGRRWVQAKMGRGRQETGLAADELGQARDRLGLLGDGRTELFGSTLGLGRVL